jgi:hypothetical protein
MKASPSFFLWNHPENHQQGEVLGVCSLAVVPAALASGQCGMQRDSITSPTTRAATRRRNGALGAALMGLTDDCTLKVLGCFDARMLWTFMLTCKHLHRLACEDSLWQALLVAEVGEENLPPPADGDGSWRRRFWQWQQLESCLCEQRVGFDPDASPTPRFLHRSACIAGRWLYIFGGRGLDSEFSDLWVLDNAAALRSPFASSSLCGDGGDGRAAGSSGSRSTGGGSAAEAPPEGAWRRIEAALAPPQRQSATLTAIGSKLVMFGGRQGEVTFLNDTWLFDTATSTWTCVRESDGLHNEAPVPEPGGGARPSPRWAHSAVSFGNRVLIFGGSAPGKCFSDLHWFDAAASCWRPEITLGASPPERSGHCACAVGDDTMFVFGGNTVKVRRQRRTHALVLTDVPPRQCRASRAMRPPLLTRCDLPPSQSSFNDLWEFSVQAASWRLVRAMGPAPHGRVGHTITTFGSRLLVFGGRDYAKNRFDPALHTFNCRTREWRQVPLRAAGNFATQRTGHCATAHACQLIVFGGLNDRNTLLDDVTSIQLIP